MSYFSVCFERGDVSPQEIWEAVHVCLEKLLNKEIRNKLKDKTVNEKKVTEMDIEKRTYTIFRQKV